MNVATQTDANVMAAAIEDPDSFALVFERHFDRIAGYVARRAPASRVEELTSEVFVRAFTNRARYNPEKADVLPWLYGIATNVLRETAREERRARALVARIGAKRDSSPVSSTEEPSLLAPPLAVALGSLTADEREPLFLYALADLDYRQIAQALDVPVGTVKSRVNRARALLRRQLGQPAEIPQIVTREGVSNG